jgi:hypothetical protein
MCSIAALGILAIRSADAAGSGETARRFAVVTFLGWALLALFFALAIANIRRPESHKRYMVLAMIAILSPASARILIALDLAQYNAYFVPGMAAAFVIACMAYDWRKFRVIHPVYLIGGAVIVASWPWRYMAARQDWYQPIGEWIARMGARSRKASSRPGPPSTTSAGKVVERCTTGRPRVARTNASFPVRRSNPFTSSVFAKAGVGTLPNSTVISASAVRRGEP